MRTFKNQRNDIHLEGGFPSPPGYLFSTHFFQKNGSSEYPTCRFEQDLSLDYPLFTFTGKERDAETGYSYFGARYYDSDLSGLFLSVDPISDKYPSLSPYAYCAWNPVKLVDPDGKDCKIAVNSKKKTITVSVNIILFGKQLSSDQLNKVAAQYQKDIMKMWSKDEKGNDWEYKGYKIIFDVNVSVDQKAAYNNDRRRDYKSGDNNYIQVCKDGTINSHTDRSMNTGQWEEPNDHDAAPHEFGHLLGLKDRYSTYTKSRNGRTVSGYIPFTGWEGNIMAEHENGRVEQRNIDAIFNGRSIQELKGWIKRAKDHE